MLKNNHKIAEIFTLSYNTHFGDQYLPFEAKLRPPKPWKNALLLCHSLSLTYGSLQQCKSSVSVRDRLRVRMLFPGLSCPRVPASHPIFLSVINNAGEMAATRDESPHRDGGEPTGSCLQSPKKVPSVCVGEGPHFLCLSLPPSAPPIPPPLPSSRSLLLPCRLHVRRPCDQLLLRPTFNGSNRSRPEKHTENNRFQSSVYSLFVHTRGPTISVLC